MVKISVVIPVYNVEKYLRRCLDTVLDQTFGLEYEIICVDDGSTDSSPEILSEYVQKYPDKIKIISQENKGLSEARNAAMKYVSGKYTMFVDSDDFIARNALEGLYNFAESHNSEVIIFDFLKGSQGINRFLLNHYDKILKKYGDSSFNADMTEPYVFGEVVPGTWSKFYLTDLIKNIKFLPGVIYEDVCYWTEVFTKAKRLNYYPVPFYFYVENRVNSLTAEKSKKAFDVFKVFAKDEKILRKSGYFEKHKDYYYLRFASYVLGVTKKIYPEYRKELIRKIKKYDTDIDYEKILNGNFLKYQKEDIFFIKFVKENNFDKIEEFCYEKGIWRMPYENKIPGKDKK